MLSVALRRSIGLRSTGLRTYARRRRDAAPTNPGLKRQIRVLNQAGVDVPPDGDLEDMLEESEADMQNMHLAYDRYVEESDKQRDKVRHKIIEQKYFDEQLPNLLTWSEKEQIRYLAIECADEWPLERIAESFPVTVDIVKKLVKYPWKPATEDRIARHDHSAMRNWKELQEGTLDIPKDLRERFLKFSNRAIPPLRESSIKREISLEKIGEFQAIIEKCAATERKKKSETTDSDDEEKMQTLIQDESLQAVAVPKRTQTDDDDKTNLKYQRNRKVYTLDELKQNINQKLASGKTVNDLQQFIVKSQEPKNDIIPKVSSADYSLDDVHNQAKQVTAFKEDLKTPTPPVEIPNRIRIPKSVLKKGKTYRVNDCFYDYDGVFLYRVPGLVTGEKSSKGD